MIQSRDAWNSKRFHLHMTKSILFLNLQLCSVLLRTRMVQLEVYFIIYLALSTPPYFLL